MEPLQPLTWRSVTIERITNTEQAVTAKREVKKLFFIHAHAEAVVSCQL